MKKVYNKKYIIRGGVVIEKKLKKNFREFYFLWYNIINKKQKY